VAEMATLPHGEVTIAGRVFTLGAVYMRRPSPGPSGPRPPRRLPAYTGNSPLPGGRVTVAPVPSGVRRVMSGVAWAIWAGEERAA
jgi:hypothetical protein